MTNDRITDRYGLRDYEQALAANRIVEGDEPATDRERVDALIRATDGLDQSEREWAAGDCASGKGATFWCERRGRVMRCETMMEWDYAHSRGSCLKADA
jgi:hypothetical protein